MLNDVDIDFRIRGLPHSVVKQTDNCRVRELVKKIENHRHRQPCQHQNNAYNPFSERSPRQCGAVCVRDRTKNAMQILLFLLQIRHQLFHLRASLE